MMAPAQLIVPSTFVTVLGSLSRFVLIPSRMMVWMSMKLWVALQSSNPSSWVLCLVVVRGKNAYIVSFSPLDTW